MAYAPVAAERIPVGKGRGYGHTQESINELLVERALQGQRVVRLKGGDGFVFGRGGEEMFALERAGIEVDVVPGLSSAIAAAGLAGIPVTDRRCASSFTVITGHNALSSEACDSSLTRGTLVVLMAATTAHDVAKRLLRAGRPTKEPVAFVHHAGTPNQATFVTTLAAVASNGCPFISPVVMIVGEAVDYRRSDEIAAPPTSGAAQGRGRAQTELDGIFLRTASSLGASPNRAVDQFQVTARR